MNIVEFDSKFLTSIADFCKASMPLDPVNASLLNEKILLDQDYNPNLTLVDFEESQPVGFIMGVIRERDTGLIGYVKLLGVHPERRRLGIASGLYDLVEKRMREKGVGIIRVYESWPNYFMPGIDPFYTEAVCFFERKKFKKIGDTSNLVCRLIGKNFDTLTEENQAKDNGVDIRRAIPSDYEEMMNWIDQNFKAWRYEVESSFANNPISLHIGLIGKEIIAFSAYEGNNKGLGWFGPMGTTEAARGKGVGGILLKRCIADMQKIGFENAIIPWVGPIPFYMHYINSKVDRVFWRYEKILK